MDGRGHHPPPVVVDPPVRNFAGDISVRFPTYQEKIRSEIIFNLYAIYFYVFF